MSKALLRTRAAPSAEGEARMRRAALAAFVEKGFHGANMRDIAERAEASVSHVYYYFSSKQAILFHIVHDVTVELADILETAEQSAGDDPADGLAAVVRAHVLFHAERQDESFIGNSELRSLGVEERAQVMAYRDRVTAAFERAVSAGVRAGRFDCSDPRLVSRAIVTMATSVAVWHRPNGAMTPEDIAREYVALALRMVGEQT